jgi:hypothetical protein
MHEEVTLIPKIDQLTVFILKALMAKKCHSGTPVAHLSCHMSAELTKHCFQVLTNGLGIWS